MKRKSFMGVFLFIISAILLVGCSGNTTSSEPTDTQKGTDSGTSGASEVDKTLTIAVGADMVSFDIHNHNNTSTEAIHVNMFNYLFKKDANGEVLP